MTVHGMSSKEGSQNMKTHPMFSNPPALLNLGLNQSPSISITSGVERTQHLWSVELSVRPCIRRLWSLHWDADSRSSVTRHCMLFEWVAIVMEGDELSSALIEAVPGPPSPPLTLHPQSTPVPGGKWVEVWLCEKINFLSSLWTVELARSRGRTADLGVQNDGMKMGRGFTHPLLLLFRLAPAFIHIRRASERAWVVRGHLCGFIVPFTAVHSHSGRSGGGLVTGTGPLFSINECLAQCATEQHTHFTHTH